MNLEVDPQFARYLAARSQDCDKRVTSFRAANSVSDRGYNAARSSEFNILRVSLLILL